MNNDTFQNTWAYNRLNPLPVPILPKTEPFSLSLSLYMVFWSCKDHPLKPYENSLQTASEIDSKNPWRCLVRLCCICCCCCTFPYSLDSVFLMTHLRTLNWNSLTSPPLHLVSLNRFCPSVSIHLIVYLGIFLPPYKWFLIEIFLWIDFFLVLINE